MLQMGSSTQILLLLTLLAPFHVDHVLTTPFAKPCDNRFFFIFYQVVVITFSIACLSLEDEESSPLSTVCCKLPSSFLKYLQSLLLSGFLLTHLHRLLVRRVFCCRCSCCRSSNPFRPALPLVFSPLSPVSSAGLSSHHGLVYQFLPGSPLAPRFIFSSSAVPVRLCHPFHLLSHVPCLRPPLPWLCFSPSQHLSILSRTLLVSIPCLLLLLLNKMERESTTVSWQHL